MSNIKGKRILLMAPVFFNLRTIIETELIKKGALVKVIDTYGKGNRYKLLRNISNKLFKIIHTQDLIKEEVEEYDYLLVLGEFSATGKFIQHLKKCNRDIKTFVYFWDSFVTWNFVNTVDLFDYRYSFDYLDCQKYKDKKLIYLPLFYPSSEPMYNKGEKLYDVVHIGSLGPKYKTRIPILRQVIKECKSNNLSYHIHSYSPYLKSSFFIYCSLPILLRDFLKYGMDSSYRKHIQDIKKFKNEGFIFDSIISPSETLRIENQAKSVVDINILNAGTSYRIITALSTGTKVITTNKYIQYEQFYCPENVYIMEKGQPVIDPEFIRIPFKKVDMQYLRIDNWLDTIFNI